MRATLLPVRPLALCVTVGLWAAACGGTSTDGDGNGTGGVPVQASEFPTRFAQSLCSSMANCCSANGFRHDYETCRASLEAQMNSLLRAREGMQTRFDATSAGACLDSYTRALRDCVPTESDACKHLFVGLVPAGGNCTESVECSEADGNSYCDQGICTVDGFGGDPVTRTLGQSCNQTCTRDGSGWGCSSVGGSDTSVNDSCFTNDGLYCDAATLVCATSPALGAPCTYSTGCAAGAFCDGNTCVARRATGPCSSFDACLETAYCNTDSQTCVPRVADGASCSTSEECLIDNCQDGLCRARVPVDAGMCVGLLD